MSESALRFLQQENIRLNKEVETLDQENNLLTGYLAVVQQLYYIQHTITAESSPLDMLDQLLSRTVEKIGAGDGSITLLDKATDEMVFQLVHGALGQQLPGYRINSDAGIIGWVVKNKEPIIVNNPAQDWRFSHVVDNEFSFLTNRIVAVPIMFEENLIGVIELLNKRANRFNEADVTVLLMLGQVAAIVFSEIEKRIGLGQAAEDNYVFNR
jgi:GAF domain-containing protein